VNVRKRTAEIAGSGVNTDARSSVTRVHEDEALIDRARRGERAAFGELYDRYVGAVYRYVAYRVRDDDAAEDVTADVFIKAMVGLPRYEPRQAFLAWLYRIARNTVIDRTRLAYRRTETALSEPLAAALPARDDDFDPEARALATDRRELLRTALARLSGDQQDVLVLRLIAGLSAEEVGVVMGKPASTVRGIHMRGLRSLRRYLSPDDLR
jgi:RNA polymerase sigma-70 factor (ECF subfamily)